MSEVRLKSELKCDKCGRAFLEIRITESEMGTSGDVFCPECNDLLGRTHTRRSRRRMFQSLSEVVDAATD